MQYTKIEPYLTNGKFQPALDIENDDINSNFLNGKNEIDKQTGRQKLILWIDTWIDYVKQKNSNFNPIIYTSDSGAKEIAKVKTYNNWWKAQYGAKPIEPSTPWDFWQYQGGINDMPAGWQYIYLTGWKKDLDLDYFKGDENTLKQKFLINRHLDISTSTSVSDNTANALSTEPVLKPAPNPIQDTVSKISTWLSQLIHFGSESKAEGESSTKQTIDKIPKAEEQTKATEEPQIIESTIPTQVLSPVIGPLGYTTCCDENCQNRIVDKWEFCQHKSPVLVKSATGEWVKIGHIPNGGIGQADDTYAWDVNYNLQNKKDEDAGMPVYAVASGKVATTYGGRLNIGGSYGQVLVEHPGGWWSGYLHMKNVKVTEGQNVNDKTLLGYVSDVGASNNHLHFVIYQGENKEGGLKSFNIEITPRDQNP